VRVVGSINLYSEGIRGVPQSLASRRTSPDPDIHPHFRESCLPEAEQYMALGSEAGWGMFSTRLAAGSLGVPVIILAVSASEFGEDQAVLPSPLS
jgi:hypothetical protein